MSKIVRRRELAPNVFVKVPGLKCPECGEQVLVAINEWATETGEPTGFEVSCENEDGAGLGAGDDCEECGGSGWFGYDESESGGDVDCEACAGRGFLEGHRHWQSDWQPIVDRAEAWASKRFVVSERGRA